MQTSEQVPKIPAAEMPAETTLEHQPEACSNSLVLVADADNVIIEQVAEPPSEAPVLPADSHVVLERLPSGNPALPNDRNGFEEDIDEEVADLEDLGFEVVPPEDTEEVCHTICG